MDIQVSSNFERLLYEATGRDGAEVARLMASLAQSGACEVPDAALAAIRARFASGRADEAETAATIAEVFRSTGRLVDPHTAVGIAVANRFLGGAPMVTLSTADPAKFPDAVEAATGVRPGLPARLSDLMEREEHFSVLPADLGVIEGFVERRSRAVRI
jgi:threonine synthase